MKVLVIGGLGFIGSNLCKRLLKKNHDVICIDNLGTGKKENVMDFMFDPRFHLDFHDIVEPFSPANVDVIIHCAIASQKDLLHFMKTCTYGIFNAAGMARRNKARLIYLSSYAYYGTYNGSQINEDASSINIGNAICSGIQAAEYILRNYNLDIRILRVFDAYGKKMPNDCLLYNIIRKVRKGHDVEVNNTNDLVSLCHVKDILDAICCTMEIDKFKGPLNIGADSYTTVENIFNVVKKICDSKSKLINKSDRSIFMNPVPNTNKAKDVLKWNQKIDFEWGIKDIIEYMDSREL